MATNYPGAIDSLTNPAAGNALNSPSHAGQHANANDAIEAIETELGTDPSGGSATVKARFEVIEANDWVTSARIAADAVGTSEIAADAVGSSELADNAVNTAALLDGAVTAPKILIGAATVGSGTGVPNGVVTATPGSSWLQIGDAVTVSGNLLWRKTTGTGNTGWVPEGALADTGWRDVSASFTGGYTTPQALVRRVGAAVQVRCYSGTTPTLTNNDWNTLVNLPAGFRPRSSVDPVVWNAGFTGDIRRAYVSTAGDVRLMGAGATVAAMTLHSTFTTIADWPSSLPGSAL